jgi:alginate O-acetyltransferase complex protein AlgI
MIFNTWDYYLLFLIPSAILVRLASPRVRPWLLALSGGLFFVYFSYTQLGGLIGAACLGIFLWEAVVVLLGGHNTSHPVSSRL